MSNLTDCYHNGGVISDAQPPNDGFALLNARLSEISEQLERIATVLEKLSMRGTEPFVVRGSGVNYPPYK